jgi:tetratricopeptide (TPR) repeat protein
MKKLFALMILAGAFVPLSALAEPVPSIGAATESATQSDMATAAKLVIENKPQEAIDLLNKSINKSPNDKELFAARGRVYRNMQMPDEALRDFNKAISIDPDWFQGYKKRGEYFSFFSKYDEAMNDYAKCISLAPTYGEVYLSRAMLFAKKAKYKEALEDLNKAEQYNAENQRRVRILKAACTDLIEEQEAASTNHQ